MRNAGNGDADILLRFGSSIQNLDKALNAQDLAPWDSSKSVCQWGGITCLARTTHVTNVTLAGLGLRGKRSLSC